MHHWCVGANANHYHYLLIRNCWVIYYQIITYRARQPLLLLALIEFLPTIFVLIYIIIEGFSILVLQLHITVAIQHHEQIVSKPCILSE